MTVDEDPRVTAKKKVLDFSDVREPIDVFLDAVYGDGVGWAAISIGRLAPGREHQQPGKARKFQWPADRVHMLQVAAVATAKGKAVFWSPVLWPTDEVSPAGGLTGEPVTPMTCLWADVDDNRNDANLKVLQAADATFVRSGSEGRFHVYLPMAEGVDLKKHQDLNQRLRMFLDCDSKFQYKTWLRLPGSLNDKVGVHKTVRLISPRHDVHQRFGVASVEALIGSVASDRSSRVSSHNVEPIERVRPPQGFKADKRFRLVMKLVRTKDVDDRSDALWALASACHEAGLTLEQTAWFVDRHTPSTDKYGDRLDAQVRYVWAKIADPQGEFWDERAYLRVIHDFALSRRIGPWGVLGVAMCRAICAVPPSVTLPPLVGSRASLNLFVGLAAKSGGGKSVTIEATKELIEGLPYFPSFGIGSGEGIPHLFARRETIDKESVVRQHTTSVLVTCEEVDTLTGIGKRSASTLLPELRKAWSGESLGASNADPNKTIPVAGHAYRLALIVGLQPKRAESLTKDDGGGTMQRFLWLPTEHDHPEVRPPAPGPLVWHLLDEATPQHIDVCEAVRLEIDADHLKRMRGLGDDEKSHANLVRLKVAAALALLDKRYNVDRDDWRLAGVVMDVSDRTFRNVRSELHEAKDHADAVAGRAEGIKQAAAADAIFERVTGNVLNKIEAAGTSGLARNDLKKQIAHRDRELISDVVDWLIEAGHVRDGGTRLFWRSTPPTD